MQVMAGGTSMFGGGPDQLLTDLVDIGNVESKTYMLSELMSVVDGPFCYFYQ